MSDKVTKPARAVNKKALKGKKDEPVVDATIISEKTDEIVEPKADDHTSFRNASENTIKKDDAGHIKSTADINLDDNKDEADSARVNFMDDNYMASMLNKKTEKSEEKNEGEEKKAEQTSSSTSGGPEATPDANAFTKDDMQDFAEVFMDILDMGISTALKFYSKDSSTTAYELGADKKRRLVRQLTNLFMKYQMKFSLEFMFVVTLLICYSVPIAKAKKIRKEIKEGTFKREGGKPGKG